MAERVTVEKIQRVLEYLRLGHTVREAAAAVDCHPTTLYRILPHEYEEEYRAAVETGKAALADRARTLTWRAADDGEWKAIDKLGNVYVEEMRPGTQRVEITGDGGGPVQLESKGVSLAAILHFAQQHGIDPELDAGPVAALPAARALLPEPGDGERPAGDVPDPPAP